MTENDYLDPFSIEKQSNNAISKLIDDDLALTVMKNTIHDFRDVGELKGASFDTLKKNLEQYETIISNMREANHLDESDYRSLKWRVGFEILDGSIIIPAMNDALKSKKENEDRADHYNSLANSASDPDDADAYRSTAAFYSGLALIDYGIYLYFKGKADKYDSIEEKTSGLFSSSIGYRELCVANPNSLNSVALDVSIVVNGLATDDFKTKFNNNINVTRQCRETYEKYCNKPLDFSTMTKDEKEVIINYYEMMHPRDKKNMNIALKAFADEGYDEHIMNIKVITYTAEEPYRGLFIENAKNVRVLDLHYGGTSHYSPGDYPDNDGIYLNVDDKYDFDTTDSGSYNVYFHEISHGIDTRTGAGTAVTSTYINSDGLNTNEVLKNDVATNIENHANDYFDSVNIQEPDKSRYAEEVVSKIMNTVDAKNNGMLTVSDFSSEDAYKCYNDVVKNMNSELRLHGRTNDIYGAFTGNTITNGYLHDATKGKDSNGNVVYRLYWVQGEIDQNGNTKISYDSKGDVQYTNHISSEFFAENMAAKMTRESNEIAGYNYYSDDSREMFYELVIEMSDK